MSVERLHPADVEAIAEAVARRLQDDPVGGRWLDAAQTARLLGVSREAIYREAARLGAVRIGTGPKARLRFDREKVVEVLTARSAGDTPMPQTPKRRRASRQAAPGRTRAGSPLLPLPAPRSG